MLPFPFAPRHATGVRPDFRAEVERVLAGMPYGILRVLDVEGYALVTGRTMLEAEPVLRGQAPRGYPPDATWANLSGGFQGGGAKRIVLAETYEDYDTGLIVFCTDVAEALRHEIGHALDEALGGASTADEFRAAYLLGRKRADEWNLRDRLEYFLNETVDAGAEETFAELVAIMSGGGAAGMDELMRSTFYEALSVVTRILEGL